MGSSGIWINRETTLWIFRSGQEGVIVPTFDPEQDCMTVLLSTGVREIQEGLQDDVAHWECGKCGQVNEGYELCIGCSAPRLSRLRQAKVILEGRLPNAAYLAELNRNFGMEITRRKCGRRDLYHPKDMIMRFVNCRVTGRWVKNAVALGGDEIEVMTLCVRVACQFFMRINGTLLLVASEKEH